MADLDQILENFCQLDHVYGAAVFDANGFVIEKYFREENENETDPLAEVILRSLQAGMQIAEELGKAPLTQQYLEFEEKQITAEVVGENFVLVVLAGSGANLGRVRLEIRRNRGAVERLLAV
ncbi:MAG: roadblock/LC7 domain-containing protein [Vulcanimicrobiota bacterium]